MADTFITKSVAETKKIASNLVKKLKFGGIIALCGELGAGKTQFIKGMANALNIHEENVTSPTFTIINEYSGSKKLFHMDFYRLNAENDLSSLGLDDYFYSGEITAVEWANKFENVFPKETIWVNIDVIDEIARKITIQNYERGDKND